MEFNKILNELGPSSWNVDHLEDLITRAKSCSPKYFVDKYHQELTTIPKNYARQFINKIKNTCPDLFDKLTSEYKTFKEVKNEY